MRVKFLDLDAKKDRSPPYQEWEGDIVGYVSHDGEIHAVVALLNCIKHAPLKWVTRIDGK